MIVVVIFRYPSNSCDFELWGSSWTMSMILIFEVFTRIYFKFNPQGSSKKIMAIEFSEFYTSDTASEASAEPIKSTICFLT